MRTNIQDSRLFTATLVTALTVIFIAAFAQLTGVVNWAG